MTGKSPQRTDFCLIDLSDDQTLIIDLGKDRYLKIEGQPGGARTYKEITKADYVILASHSDMVQGAAQYQDVG